MIPLLCKARGDFFWEDIWRVKLPAHPEWRLLLVVGGLGGYSAFSTFQYETGKLVAGGELIYIAPNIVLSFSIGFVALKPGEVIARGIQEINIW